MRAIDADATIKEIKARNPDDVSYEDAWAITCIEHAPTIEPEQQWIPCGERLPGESGRYLVTRGLKVCDSLWNRIYIANYSDLMGLKRQRIWWQGNIGKSDFERLDDVLAWMPLPEPYRKRMVNGD